MGIEDDEGASPSQTGASLSSEGGSAARRRSDHQFRALVNAVEEYAIFRLDPDGHVVSWNSGAERIKGYSEAEILGEHFSTFYTEEDRSAGIPEANLAATAEQGSVEDEGWRVRADGSLFWANVTITAIRDESGDLEGFAKVTRDLTERHQREEQLRQERAFTGQVLETAPASIFVFDAAGDVVMANERLRKTLGMDEVAGELSVGDFTILDESGNVVPPEERPYVTAFDTGEGVDDWQCQVELPTGDRRWFTVNVTPIDDGDSGVERVVVAAQDVTQLRKQAERLERQRDELESELAEVFERVDEAFMALDEEWHITYVNDQAAELVQLPPEELLEARVWDALYEIADGEPRDMAEEAMATNEPLEFEFYSDVLDIWVEVRGYPSKSGMSVYFRDITERKERERELRETRERMEFALNATDAVVWDWDVDADRASFYPSAESLYGTTVENWEDFIEVIHPEDVETVQEGIEHSLETGKPKHEEIRIIRDGEVRWIEAPGHPVEDADGSTRMVGVARDITERKEREQELEQYETIIESVNEGVYVVDADRNLQWVNETYAEILGYEREELIGENATKVVPDDEVIRKAERIEDEQGYENLPRMDLELQTADGDRVPVDATSTVLPGGKEDDWFRAGVVRDITKRKERERRLEEFVDKLEESNERLEHFAYIASHDLQEPLRMVTNYLQLLEVRYGDQLDADAREFIDFAVDGAERMREMISDLLAYSRIDTDVEPLEPADTEQIVENVLRDLELRIEETDAEIDVGSLPTVHADPNQLEQVFQNLLSNAIKYRGEESPRITVSAERDAEEWVFRVADNGIGIDPEQADHIFDVFERLHTNEEYPGTGIGLALCKKIVERHGGDIWVESEPGEGSTFYFTLSTTEAARNPI